MLLARLAAALREPLVREEQLILNILIQLPERPQIVPLFSSKHAIVWERGGAEFNGSMGAALVWLNVAPPEERLDVGSAVAGVPLHAAAARFCV